MSNTKVTYRGIGFAGLLTIAFIVLKLTNIISWSWLWVLSPLWIDIALVIVMAVVAAIILYTLKK